MKRFMSLLLAITLMISCIPALRISVQATDEDVSAVVETVPEETTPEETVPEEPELTVEEITVSMEAAASTTGITWDLSDDGTLTISGSGTMGDFETGVPWASQRDAIQKVVIENGITSISCGAFAYCKKLQSVTIPDSVTSIEGAAFYFCESLQSITIPSEMTRIESETFYGCASLNNVIIPEDVTVIDDLAFGFCESMTDITIGDKITYIGEGAFRGCKDLTDISLPKTLESLGEGAFDGCEGLTDVYYAGSEADKENIDFDYDNDDLLDATWHYAQQPTSNISWTLEDGTLTISGEGEMTDAPWLEQAESIKKVVIEDGITSIGEGAFMVCENLTSVAIPNSVTSIGDHAFNGCIVLEEINIPDTVTAMGNSVFFGCEKLSKVSLGRITAIGESAFSFCWALTEITIPDSVTTIGIDAFSNTCLEKVVIPEGVTTVDIHAFYSCPNLMSITLPKSIETLAEGAFGDCGNLMDVYYTGTEADKEAIVIGDDNAPLASTYWYVTPSNISWTLEDGVLTISGEGEMEFEKAPWGGQSASIEKAVIENGITSIGYDAFAYCSNLTSVTIPNSVTSIDVGAFYCCSALTDITIPSGVTSIGSYAFYWCTSLTSIVIPDGVTSIGEYTFYGCEALADVTLGSNVTSIGNFGFHTCRSLTNFTIPDSVTTIGEYAFAHCDALTEITISDNVTSLGSNAFFSCVGLTSATVGSGVTTLYLGTFAYCSELTEITIPTSIQTIDAYVFYDCNALTDVYYAGSEIEKGGINIGDNNLPLTSATWHYNCKPKTWTLKNGVLTISGEGEMTDAPWLEQAESIEKVIIEDGITSIDNSAFEGCTALTEITIPDSVTSIGTHAFYNCEKLKDVYYLGSKAEAEKITIVETDNEKLTSATWHYTEEHVCEYTSKVTAPTCTSKGYTTYTCDCGNSYVSDYKPVAKHSYTKKVTAPTYTKQGYTTYTCACGDTYKSNYTKALGLPKPSVKVANDTATGKPKVSWAAIKEVSRYDVYRATSQTGTYTKLGSTTKTAFVDTTATLGKTYYYKVKAICTSDSSLSSGYSSIVSISTKVGQPKVTLSKNTKGNPVLKWGKVEGAKKYEVYVATSENGTYKKLTTTSKLTYTYTKAAAGKEYFFKVRAYGSSTATAGAYCEPLRAVKVLATPKLTVTTKQATGQNTLKWKKITGATAYVLQCSINGGSYKTIATTSKLTYTHTGLSGGNTYTYRLMAKSGVADAASSYSATKTTVIKCAAPSVSVTLNSKQKPTVTWQKVAGAVKYQVYYATAKSGKYKLVATVTGTSYTHSAAPTAKACYYKVVAVDKNGNLGSYSTVKNITTKCLAPTGVKVTANAKGKPVVSWSKTEGAKKYEIYVATSLNGTYKKLTTTSKQTYTYTKAKTGTAYYFKITAYGASTSSRSAYSPTVKF